MAGWKDLHSEQLPAPMRARWEAFREDAKDNTAFQELAELAAFPPVITADLLSTLVQNFMSAETDITVRTARLLLSPLCRPLGRGLYEIYTEIREMLQGGLKDSAQEIRLARFLEAYRLERAAEIQGPAMREALRWAALTVLDPKTAAEEYLNAYNQNDRTRLTQMETWHTPTRAAQKGGASPFQAAVQLVRGIRQFEAGQKTGTEVEKLRELKSMLQMEEGGNRIKTRVPEELWQHLQQYETEPLAKEEKKPEFVIKIHILVGEVKDIDGMMFSGFGAMGNFSEMLFNTSPLPLFEKERATIFMNAWQANADQLPGILDNLWITPNGIYFVAIDYHPFLSDPNAEQTLNLQRLIERYQIRLPSDSRIYVILGYKDEFVPHEQDIILLTSNFPQVEKFLPLFMVGSWLAGFWDLIYEETIKETIKIPYRSVQNFKALTKFQGGIYPAKEPAATTGFSPQDPGQTISHFIEFAARTGAVIPEEQSSGESDEEILMVTEPDLFLQNLTPLFRVDQPWNAGPTILNIGDLKGYHDPEWTARILESYCLVHTADQERIEIPWRVKETHTSPIIDRKKETVRYLIFSLNPFCEAIVFQFQVWIKRLFPFAPMRLSRSGFALEISETVSELMVMIELEELEDVFKTVQRLAGDLRLEKQQSALFNLHEKYKDNETKFVNQVINKSYYQQIKNSVITELKKITGGLPLTDNNQDNLKIEAVFEQHSKTFTLQLAGNTSDQEVKYWIAQFDNFQLRYFPGLTHTLTQRFIPACATPEMVRIEGGAFQMGDTLNDNEFDREKPVHQVTLDTFAIGKYPVTMEEYDAFCEATDRAKPKDEGWGRGNRPAINVSWHDAAAYCNWLSETWGLEPAYRISGERVEFNRNAGGYRLPTEAEWEFAARAFSPSGGGQGEGLSPSVGGAGGGKVRFGNGKDVADPKEINFNTNKSYKKPYSKTGEYRGRTTPVDQFPPNPLGLHDMSGNVWEWCWDWYGDYNSNPQTNPTGPDSGSNRVYRGGSWFSLPVYVRCAYRGRDTPDSRLLYLGFRLARTVTS